MPGTKIQDDVVLDNPLAPLLYSCNRQLDLPLHAFSSALDATRGVKSPILLASLLCLSCISHPQSSHNAGQELPCRPGEWH